MHQLVQNCRLSRDQNIQIRGSKLEAPMLVLSLLDGRELEEKREKVDDVDVAFGLYEVIIGNREEVYGTIAN